jgi:hypothetical protein
MSKVVWNGDEDECWTFQGYRNLKGYGTLGVGSRSDGTRRKALAHRIAYELFVGPIPEGLFVCHTCDNPPCVNPAHLFLGTNADNMADASAKGRMANNGAPSGERNPSSKLNAAIAREVRRKHAGGCSQAALAREFGVSDFAIFGIVHRKTWVHV